MVVKNARLIEGPVQKTLIRLTLPMVLGTIGMVIFNLSDSFLIVIEVSVGLPTISSPVKATVSALTRMVVPPNNARRNASSNNTIPTLLMGTIIEKAFLNLCKK